MTKCIAHNVRECAECRRRDALFYHAPEQLFTKVNPPNAVDTRTEQPFLFEIGPAAPSSENVAISFTAAPVGPLFLMGPGMNEVLRFEAGGNVYVRGEKVDSNVKVYEAFKEWLTAMGILQ